MGFFKKRRTEEHGMEGTAVLLDSDTVGVLVSDAHDDLVVDPERQVLDRAFLRIQPSVGAPYEIELKGRDAKRFAGWFRGDGSEVPVRIDPEDPTMVVVDEEKARPIVDAELDLLERIDRGEDIELPPESRWPTKD